MTDEWWAGEPEDRQPAFEQKHPGRMQAELDQLGKFGRVGEVLREFWNVGILAVEYDWLRGETTMPLRIIYPTTFPWVRPRVYMKGDRTSFPRRHCDPIDGEMCYLGREEHQWRPQDSVAELINEQLPRILDKSYTPEEEDPVPEPAERWWNAFAPEGSLLLIDSAWSSGNAQSGSLSLLYRVTDRSLGTIRAVVQSVKDLEGNILATWSSKIPQEFNGCSSIEVPWIRSSMEQFPNSPERVVGTYAPLLGRAIQPKPLGDKLVGAMFAILHPTELEYEREGDSWLCFLSFGAWKNFKADAKEKPKTVTLRTLRAGLVDRTSRSPAAAVLSATNGVVAGLGAIGAPIALELARNGLRRLTAIDYDRVTPGNSVRWPLGEPAWGEGKPEALKAFLGSHYPECDVQPVRLDVGEHLGLRRSDGQQLVEALTSADVVVDATTSFGVLSALYETCSDAGVPLVSASATPPLKGGSVVSFTSGGGCPTCLLFHYAEGAISAPPGEGEATDAMATVGCSQITFSGSSFDLQEISLQAVRVAVHTVSSPDSERSVLYTLAFGETPFARVPEWTAIPFGKHPSCSCGRL